MITQSLLTRSSLFILSLHLLQQISAANSYCTPSACGTIRNISSPFRLKDDPPHCGDPTYELVCENNVTSVYLRSHKYHVREINYSKLTIRLVDVSMNSSICSIPSFFELFYNSHPSRMFHPYLFEINEIDSQIITFMTCPDLLNRSSLLIQLPDCQNSFNSSGGRHTYMQVGQTFAQLDVRYMCTIEFLLPTSWNVSDLDNVTLSKIHQSLLYGFELSFKRYHKLNKWDIILYSFCPSQDPWLGWLMTFLLLVGVSLSAKIIIVFGALFCLVFVNKWDAINTNRIIVVIFGVRFLVGIICAMGFLFYTFRKRHLSMYEAIEVFLQSDNKLVPIRYSYSDLKKITRHFREKLGEGGFGSVYKGKLRSGHDVAVKLLRSPRENSQDFMNEIATIGRIHHVNVVKLVGYCAERSKRALLFDFMSNGSLDKYIFGREETNCLDWDTKFKIAIGVARGIEYLHNGCDIQILHFDIKPHNILLDDMFVPKISDFGLAKLCSIDKDTVTLTAVRGTIGYVAPELINRSIGRVSYKADVYSFGMLLMEMVGMNRDLKEENDDSNQYFPYWIYDRFKQDRDIEIGKAEESISDNDEGDSAKKLVRKMTIVALWCIQMNPDNRPSMSKVLKMLEGEVERLQIPNYPSQSFHLAVNEDETCGGTYSTDDSVSLLHSNIASSLEITVQDRQSLLNKYVLQ